MPKKGVKTNYPGLIFSKKVGADEKFLKKNKTKTGKKKCAKEPKVKPKEVQKVEPEQDQEETEEEQLEFTKPTINQKTKVKKDTPMCYDPHISSTEFEALYDAVNDLNASVLTLRQSYGSIIKSMHRIHTRRLSKKQQSQQAKEVNFMTTLSEITEEQAKEMESDLENTDKYDLERFINPVTREATFNALFDEIAQLSAQTETVRTMFFDAKGNFMREEYDRAPVEQQMDRNRFNRFKVLSKKLATVLDEVCRNFNDDLLNEFRLSD